MEIDTISKTDLAWKFGLHMLFTFSGLFFAVTEWVMKHGEVMVHKANLSDHTVADKETSAKH